MESKWVVNVKGAPNEEHFEISVIRETNSHGIRSYGWFNSEKLLISHSGGPCQNPVSKPVWDKLIEVAKETADSLNISKEPKMNDDGQTYETTDLILPFLFKGTKETKIKIKIDSENVRLYVGHRDWQWDAKSGKFIGCGTAMSQPPEEGG